MAKKLAKLRYLEFLAIDTETTGLSIRKGARPYLVIACDHKGNTFKWRAKVNPFTREVTWTQQQLRDIKKVFNSYSTKVFHNIQFDVAMLAAIGIDLTDEWHNLHDTLLASHILDSSGRHGLKYLAKTQFNYPDDDEVELQKSIVAAHREGKKKGYKLGHIKADYWLAPNGEDEKYGIGDVERTAILFVHSQNHLEQSGHFSIYEKHRRLFPVIAKMQQNGLGIRPRKLQQEIKRYQKMEVKHYESCLRLLPPTQRINPKTQEPVNLHSSQQLSVVLYDYFKLPVIAKTDAGKPSCSAGTLDRLVSVIGDIIEKRKLTGILKNTLETAKEFIKNFLISAKCATALSYLSGYDEERINDRIFPTFNQTGTKWTRFSSQNPNAQNVGKGREVVIDGEEVVDFVLRDVFGPAKGKVWYSVDVDQLQLRIFAKVSNETRMQQAFRDGFDFHSWMAMQIFNLKDPKQITKLQRRIAKNVNFGYIFGASEKKIDATSGITGLSKQLKRMFPDADKFAASVKKRLVQDHLIYAAGGYPLTADLLNPNWKNTGVCGIVQGTEGEIIKDAMVRCHEILAKYNQSQAFLIQVHDEFVFEFDTNVNAKPILKEIGQAMIEAAMEVAGVEIKVKFEKITTSWANGKDYKVF